MLMDILMGTVGLVGTASGVSALVFYRNNGRSNSHPPPAPGLMSDGQLAKMREVFQPLALLPQQLDAHFEEFFRRLAETQLVVDADPAPPPWVAEIARGIELVREQASSEPLWPGKIIRSLQELVDLVSMRETSGQQLILDIAEGMETILKSVPQLTDELTTRLSDLPSSISRQVASTLAEERSRAGKVKEKATSPPARPPRSAPPNLPRMSPGQLPSTPSVPAPYVPGSVFVPAGEVWSLLLLIQQQLSPNCPGSSVEFALSADDTNSGPVLVGGASTLGGPLSETNYAYQLQPDGPARVYQSTYPGGNTPVGELQVLAPAGGYLHVEVQS